MKKILIIAIIASLLNGCKGFVQVDPPETSLIKVTVFASNSTATAAMMDLYASFCTLNNTTYADGSAGSVSYLGGLAADELELFSTSSQQQPYANNNLNSLSFLSPFWTAPYQQIYRANAILEGVAASTGVSESVKLRLTGEAKFLRAFAHFYLVNLFGDVPLQLTTNYEQNAIAPRTATDKVYEQIVQDLKDAESLLDERYLDASGNQTAERSRLNKYAAKAMLARVYLYTGKWADAEEKASEVITHTALYDLPAAQDVFLKNSVEAIWQLAMDNFNAKDGNVYVVSSGAPLNAVIRPAIYDMLSDADQRKINWMRSQTVGTNTYYFPYKYKAPTMSAPITEATMVIRLSELYLIRAEARAKQGHITGVNSAATDVDEVRGRAGIPGTTATTSDAMLDAIMRERIMELFTEWGHRWLDLKRTGRAPAVLSALKGSFWQDTDQLWPIPQDEIAKNPSIAGHQNPGYNN